MISFEDCLTHNSAGSIPLLPVTSTTFAEWKAASSGTASAWLAAQSQFTAKPDAFISIPDAHGAIERVLVGIEKPTIWALAALPAQLPAGTYRIEGSYNPSLLADMALGWLLGHYHFDKYKTTPRTAVTLCLPSEVALEPILRKANATALVRNLINTPTNDMGPHELAEAARSVASQFDASFHQIVGDDLLTENYPAIHAVGRASPNAPRLIDIRHGNAAHPLLTLIGKGVCFDTGGLDVKPYASMKLMKKDMGGAALMLGLAQLIMAEKLPVRLRVLIPAVENSIAGNAFRPQDILATRKGLTVEIGSPDAEGRLILCDALTEAMAESPDLVIDAATLTGAARVALGTDLPALYSNRDEIAQTLQRTSIEAHDPMWHLPLWAGYDKYVGSQIADITNSPNYGFAGSITAALYLQRFVEPSVPWVHLDTYAWNGESQPGRPVGGEALCLRALFNFISSRYSS